MVVCNWPMRVLKDSCVCESSIVQSIRRLKGPLLLIPLALSDVGKKIPVCLSTDMLFKSAGRVLETGTAHSI
jgi:hypothetical protein